MKSFNCRKKNWMHFVIIEGTVSPMQVQLKGDLKQTNFWYILPWWSCIYCGVLSWESARSENLVGQAVMPLPTAPSILPKSGGICFSHLQSIHNQRHWAQLHSVGTYRNFYPHLILPPSDWCQNLKLQKCIWSLMHSLPLMYWFFSDLQSIHNQRRRTESSTS